jgi:ABC-type lipoprotein export system ATPase subunit
MSLVEVKNITKDFSKVHALRSVSFELEEGGQYAIRGASGSGKSTLLYLLGGLDQPKTGEINMFGKDIAKLNDEDLASFRNNYVGFVFQFHFLLSSMNCIDNILLPGQIGGKKSKNQLQFAKELAEKLGVTHCLKKFPYELSGGEQQRINIIRALSLRPKLLLCDEPTGNLDSENSQIVTDLLKDLAVKFGSTLVVVTHDNQMAEQFEHQFRMRDGEIFLGS